MTIAAVIPTYNERDNIQTVVDGLLALYPELSVVVVDDNSPDGTGAAVEQRAVAEPRIAVIRRPGKQGYASALVSGMRRALEDGAEVIVQMDADLSHQPGHLPHMIEKLDDADVVIGSRYIPGGGTRNWGLPRRMLSRSANVFARTLLNLPPHDCTSGYRCYRRRVLERLNFERIHTEGYAFLIELAYICRYAGFRITEIPILFVDRRFGKSKISRQIILEALWLVFRLSMVRKPETFVGRYFKD